MQFNNFTLEHILSETNYKNRSTKIVCTLGPSCWSVEKIVELLDAGMNVARLNFSHGDHKLHGECV